MSKKPSPDITGAIQHSLAGLECVVREVTNDQNATLGKLMKNYSDVIPKPLDDAVKKVWGYASETGRHLREGNPPEIEEAELAVSLSASIITYLARKNFESKELDNHEDNLPF